MKPLTSMGNMTSPGADLCTANCLGADVLQNNGLKVLSRNRRKVSPDSDGDSGLDLEVTLACAHLGDGKSGIRGTADNDQLLLKLLDFFVRPSQILFGSLFTFPSKSPDKALMNYTIIISATLRRAVVDGRIMQSRVGVPNA